MSCKHQVFFFVFSLEDCNKVFTLVCISAGHIINVLGKPLYTVGSKTVDFKSNLLVDFFEIILPFVLISVSYKILSIYFYKLRQCAKQNVLIVFYVL